MHDEAELFRGEQLITCHDGGVGLQAVIAIDDTTLGPGFGGVRFRPYPTPVAAVAEAQRLAAAMTLKHACADLPYGGAKSVIIASKGQERAAVLARFGEFVARTHGLYVPGVDMGTTSADMQLIAAAGARTFSTAIHPGPWTARGVFAAMRAAVAHRLGADSLHGLRVAVQGVGRVGVELARLVAMDGAHLTLADVDAARARAVADELGAGVIDTDVIPFCDCDVFAPCAVARVITLANVDRLQCTVVAGAANDILDVRECATALQEADITYVPDFVANAGGVIQVHAEQSGWDDEQLGDAVDAIGDRSHQILDDAQSAGLNPLEAAVLRAQRRLTEARAVH